MPVGPAWGAVAAAVVAVLVAVGVLLARLGTGRAPRLLATLGAAGVCGLLAVLAEPTALPDGVSQRLLILSSLVLLPVALTLYPDDAPPPGLGWPAVVTVAAGGVLALVYPSPYADTGLAGLVTYLLLALVLWWRHEHADDAGRRSVLWLALGGGVAGLLGALAAFLLAPTAAAVVISVLVALAVGCLVVGLVAPDVYDVRSVCVTVVVHLVTGFLVVAVFGSVLSAFTVLGHPFPMTAGPLGVLAALCALGYHPTVIVLRGVIDRMLFGERRAPLDAASRVGERLGDDPVLALRALRESLALPYAALVDGTGATVAVTGTPTTTVVTRDLSAARPELGRLEVGLRLGEVALPARDRDVLAVLGPALAQLMHARALRADLQASRASVVAAVEEERRRLRRDLHDGLGPRLTGVAYTADAARNLLDVDPGRSRELLSGLRAEAGAAIAEVRSLVDGLRPAALDQVGLVEAIRQHGRGLRSADGRPMTVTVDATEPLPPLGAAVEVTAYRIVVEALTNAARHSGARHCRVAVCPEGPLLRLEVCDDGPAAGPWTPGVGLTSMRERAEMLGGTFTAAGGGSGGVVSATLPV